MADPNEEDRTNPEVDRTAEDILGRHPSFLAHERFVRARLAELAHRTYRHGMTAARLDLRSSDDAAAEIGMSARWVRKVAGERSIGWHAGRDWVFTGEDIEELRTLRRPVGRPRNQT